MAALSRLRRQGRLGFLLAVAAALGGCASAPRTLEVPVGAVETGRAPPPPPPVRPATPDLAPPPPPPRTVAQTPPARAPLQPRTIRAALLMPLTGPDARTYGLAMQGAAQMAVVELPDPNFRLLPVDTGSSPEGAAAAAERAVAEGAELLLGPLKSADVEAAGAVARMNGVPLVGFTTDERRRGGGVYLMGFLIGDQVSRILRFAQSQGLARIAVIVGDDPTGRVVRDAALSVLPPAQLAGTVFVPAGGGPEGVRDAVHQLLGVPPGVADDPASLAAIGQQVAFDAILLGLAGEQLAQAAAALVEAGVDRGRVRFLGTGQWDEPGLGAREPALVGGWYAAPSPAERDGWMARFRTNFGAQDPPRLATLAYDATALAITLARQGNADPARQPDPYAPEFLAQPNGFAGTDGVFRFRGDGLVERAWAVLEVTPVGSRVVDAAPQSFPAPPAL